MPWPGGLPAMGTVAGCIRLRIIAGVLGANPREPEKPSPERK